MFCFVSVCGWVSAKRSWGPAVPVRLIHSCVSKGKQSQGVNDRDSQPNWVFILLWFGVSLATGAELGFVCPCLEQHKVTFSKSFCSSHRWKAIQDFCKIILCWMGSYCSGKCGQETCNLLGKESPSESTQHPGSTWGSSAENFQHHNLDLDCSGVSLSTQVSAESRKLPGEKAADESLLASSVITSFGCEGWLAATDHKV